VAKESSETQFKKTSRATYHALKSCGYNFVSFVPDSLLKDVIEMIRADHRIASIAATREEEAIGIATGAYLGGKKAAVLMQNTGLGNSITALASLAIPYRVPLLLVMSRRGGLGEKIPTQLIMGRAIKRLLNSIGMRAFEPKMPKEIHNTIYQAEEFSAEKSAPVAVILDMSLFGR